MLKLIRRAVALASMLPTFGQAARSSPEIREFAGLQLGFHGFRFQVHTLTHHTRKPLIY